MGALGAGAQYGILMPFGRKDESEADEIGLMYMARAGYDPQESLKFWERMEQNSQGQPPEFLSTHPSHGTRIEQLRKLMPKAMEEYSGVRSGRSDRWELRNAECGMRIEEVEALESRTVNCMQRKKAEALRRGEARLTYQKSAAFGAVALGSFAAGALAVGAIALGALAIGRLAIGRARIGRLEIDELVVRKVREEGKD